VIELKKSITIGSKTISQENDKVFIIAEMSANHLQDFELAVKIIKEAAKCGVDAIKLQTYTPDTITIDCDNKYFQITQGTIWDGTTLHKLYQEAYTPWDWQPKLKKIAEEEGLICFSSPFDKTAVDFLEDMDVPAYKIASFEINDIPFIEYIASKGKPVIMSTGIARISDIEQAIAACKRAGNEQIALLKCTSAYPSPYEDINLRTIPNIAETFDVISGISDHTMGTAVSVAAAAMGAKIVEKHFTLSRSDGGPDSAFSMEPHEMKQLVESIREIEKAMGQVSYDLTPKMEKSREHSRSLFVVKDIKSGEIFTEENVRSIRPGFGMHTKYYKDVIGKTAKTDIKKGTPMDWDLIK
jgi:pseudaminic acid synthase